MCYKPVWRSVASVSLPISSTVLPENTDTSYQYISSLSEFRQGVVGEPFHNKVKKHQKLQVDKYVKRSNHATVHRLGLTVVYSKHRAPSNIAVKKYFTLHVICYLSEVMFYPFTMFRCLRWVCLLTDCKSHESYAKLSDPDLPTTIAMNHSPPDSTSAKSAFYMPDPKLGIHCNSNFCHM